MEAIILKAVDTKFALLDMKFTQAAAAMEANILKAVDAKLGF